MNIFKTFEIFLSEPLSLLKNRFIQIVNIQSDAMGPAASVDVDMMDKKTQITVHNSQKMYNLLSTVMYKKKQKASARIYPKKQQIVIGQLLKRS